MIPVPRLSVIREAGDSHVFGAGRETRAEPAQSSCSPMRHGRCSASFPMDSVVFSEQVGRGLAGCEVARDCLFRG